MGRKVVNDVKNIIFDTLIMFNKDKISNYKELEKMLEKYF